MKPNIKKLLILNAPYLLFVWLFMKIGEAFRLSPGADLSGKLLHIMEGVTAAFESPMPSLNGQDFLIGVAGAVIMRLAVYLKGKNAKKYRKGVEYGSARWGNAKDIEPYIDPDFYNNVLLTQTERLTMNSRPKSPPQPQYPGVRRLRRGQDEIFRKAQCVRKGRVTPARGAVEIPP